MAYHTLNFRVQDSESDTRKGVVSVNIPDTQTITQMQTWVTGFIPLLEAIIDGKVTDVDATISLAATASTNGVPAAGVYNERGAVFLFDTDGEVRDSVRVPAIKHALMTGDSVSLGDASVDAFVDAFTTGLSNGTVSIKPQTRAGDAFVTAVRAKKSRRK